MSSCLVYYSVYFVIFKQTLERIVVKMSDIDDDSEIYFSVKFLGRMQVVRPGGMQILTDAVQALQDPNLEMDEKMKKTKVHLFLTRSAIDILEHKTKFMLYSCALPSVSFCAVHPTQPKILGFVARHPAADMYHCYIFQSKKFSHLLVSIIGDTFQAYKQNESLQGNRDLVVEALRHKNKVLERENAELKRRLQANGENAGGDIHENESDLDQISARSGQVRFFSEDDKTPLHRNF
ncbi:PTB domain-containing engulfment adapter protein 1-like isoform X4 [Onychostoma macrolepis]|nr:PTB domain-containing engulfment adapter protein 1-like isoform X4 [Onychostoma macrolepis]